MTSLDRLQKAVPASHPGHRAAVASLRAGQPFTCVLDDDAERRAALLASVVDTLADLETRFVGVGNPLRAPLTIERLFIQVIGPETDLRHERDAAALARLLATPASDEARLIVIVEQPESFDPDGLRTLRAMAPFLGEGTPRVQILFCGPERFGTMLEAQEPVAVPAQPPEPEAAAVAPEPVAPGRRGRWALLLGTAFLLAGLGAVAWRHPALLRSLPALITLPRPAPLEPAPPVPAPAGQPVRPALATHAAAEPGPPTEETRAEPSEPELAASLILTAAAQAAAPAAQTSRAKNDEPVAAVLVRAARART